MTLVAPFPDDPPDPRMSLKSVVFIVRIVIFGMDGALALGLFDFFENVSYEATTFETVFGKLCKKR